MTKAEKAYVALSIEKKIEKRKREIKPLFKEENVGKDKMIFVENLLYQLAVVIVTLERLADEINGSDVLEDFRQGVQEFRRENPAIKTYNATVKSFTALTKQLLDLLPKADADNAGEALMAFAVNPAAAVQK